MIKITQVFFMTLKHYWPIRNLDIIRQTFHKCCIKTYFKHLSIISTGPAYHSLNKSATRALVLSTSLTSRGAKAKWLEQMCVEGSQFNPSSFLMFFASFGIRWQEGAIQNKFLDPDIQLAEKNPSHVTSLRCRVNVLNITF